jgi:hypothetical protein
VVSEWAVPVVLEIQVVRAPLLLLLVLPFQQLLNKLTPRGRGGNALAISERESPVPKTGDHATATGRYKADYHTPCGAAERIIHMITGRESAASASPPVAAGDPGS